ncbi:DNA-binding domain protein, excisionase family [Desulfosarcina variabilis str. Montpellier]
MIFIRVGELAQALGVHRNTVRNWIKGGVLDATPTVGKKYQIPKDQFLKFAESQGIPITVVQPWINADQNHSEPELLSVAHPPVKRKETPMSKKNVGSVLVVGGGIAGIQASLDLADSGYYVYLLEKSPGIGGVMAKLDKTFPTNDCAM